MKNAVTNGSKVKILVLLGSKYDILGKKQQKEAPAFHISPPLSKFTGFTVNFYAQKL